MIALLQTLQKAFLESARWLQLLTSESCNHICWNICQLWFTRKFFTRHYYL